MEFDVTVEIPKGTRNKYEIDQPTGRLRLDRTLFTATQYPADYGFVDNSIGPAQDALDALVLVPEPTFPGCLIRCRAFGLLRMTDERGPTPKVLCVPAADPRFGYLQDIADLEHFYRLEIEHFFEVYKALERGKTVMITEDSWAGREDAEAEIRRAYERAGTVPASQ